MDLTITAKEVLVEDINIYIDELIHLTRQRPQVSEHDLEFWAQHYSLVKGDLHNALFELAGFNADPE